MLQEPKCSIRKCEYFIGARYLEEGEETEVVYCKAFPNGIPSDIAYGNDKHLKVYPGQIGDYVFKKGK
jgi:hypothetical protein